MKKLLVFTCISLISILGIGLVYANPGTPTQGNKTAHKANSVSKSDFEGTWKGSEKCQGIGAPVAIVTISSKNDTAVSIKGIYSTTGEITGELKGGMVVIAKQVIPDPLFKNIKIEGTLSISKNHKTLSAVFNILNNDAKDQCSAIYNK